MSSQVGFWGTLIRDLREKQGITQRALSARSGVNRKTLRAIEEGRTTGYIDTIEAVLDYLGYELEAMERDTQDERLRRQAQLENDPQKRSALAAQKLLGTSVSLLVEAG
jgi:transcriptional regulator with XRE-family HTH domain